MLKLVDISTFTKKFKSYSLEVVTFAKNHHIRLPNIESLKGQALALMTHPCIIGKYYLGKSETQLFFHNIGMTTKCSTQAFTSITEFKRINMRGKYGVVYPLTKPTSTVSASKVSTRSSIKASSTCTTETFGITTEKMLCDISNIPFPVTMANRVMETRFTTRLRNNLVYVLNSQGIVIESYSGNVDDKVDFVLKGGKTLSVKTNLKGDKICPQLIGQATRKTFCLYFDIPLSWSSVQIKQWIMSNDVHVLSNYYHNIFCCDYLLWVNEYNAECRLIAKPDLINFPNVSFSRSAETWNESNTVRVNIKGELKPSTLGEFQFHQHRNCIKFRFKLDTLLKMI